MTELRHGVDYLIDWYSVFGVSRETDETEIKKAYRALQLKYHPDRYAGLAEEFQREAAYRSRILNEGHEVLSNPEKRRKYDEMLDNWTGPVSKNGWPVVDLKNQHFSPSVLLSDEKEIPIDVEALIRQMSGYDEATFNTVEALYRNTENPPPEIIELYHKVLRDRHCYFTFREQFCWDRIGFIGGQLMDINELAENYLDQVDQSINEARMMVEEGVTRTLVMLKAEDPKFLQDEYSKEDYASNEPQDRFQQNVKRFHDIALEKFDAAANDIKKIVEERKMVAEKQLEAIFIRYPGTQNKFFPRVIAAFVFKGKILAAPFYAQCETDDTSEGRITVGSASWLTEEHVRELREGRGVEEIMIRERCNVLFIETQEGVDPAALLKRALEEHYTKVARQEAKK